MLINTPAGKESYYDDSYIRKAAIKYRVPYVTNAAAAVAAAEGIEAARERAGAVKSLQQYHREVRMIPDEESSGGRGPKVRATEEPSNQ